MTPDAPPLPEDEAPEEPAAQTPDAPPAKTKPRKWLRRSLYAIGGIVLLLVLLVFIVPLLLPEGLVGSIVAGQIRSKLGRKASVEGASFSVFSGFMARGVTVQKRPGFGDGHLATVGKVTGGVDYGALLGGTIRVLDLHVEDVDAHVVRDRHGALSIQDILDQANSGIKFGQIVARNVKVRVTDLGLGVAEALTVSEASVGAVAGGKRTVTADATLASGGTVKVASDIHVTADEEFDTGTVELEVDSLGVGNIATAFLRDRVQTLPDLKPAVLSGTLTVRASADRAFSAEGTLDLRKFPPLPELGLGRDGRALVLTLKGQASPDDLDIKVTIAPSHGEALKVDLLIDDRLRKKGAGAFELENYYVKARIEVAGDLKRGVLDTPIRGASASSFATLEGGIEDFKSELKTVLRDVRIRKPDGAIVGLKVLSLATNAHGSYKEGRVTAKVTRYALEADGVALSGSLDAKADITRKAGEDWMRLVLSGTVVAKAESDAAKLPPWLIELAQLPVEKGQLAGTLALDSATQFQLPITYADGTWRLGKATATTTLTQYAAATDGASVTGTAVVEAAVEPGKDGLTVTVKGQTTTDAKSDLAKLPSWLVKLARVPVEGGRLAGTLAANPAASFALTYTLDGEGWHVRLTEATAKVGQYDVAIDGLRSSGSASVTATAEARPAYQAAQFTVAANTATQGDFARLPPWLLGFMKLPLEGGKLSGSLDADSTLATTLSIERSVTDGKATWVPGLGDVTAKGKLELKQFAVVGGKRPVPASDLTARFDTVVNYPKLTARFTDTVIRGRGIDGTINGSLSLAADAPPGSMAGSLNADLGELARTYGVLVGLPAGLDVGGKAAWGFDAKQEGGILTATGSAAITDLSVGGPAWKGEPIREPKTQLAHTLVWNRPKGTIELKPLRLDARQAKATIQGIVALPGSEAKTDLTIKATADPAIVRLVRGLLPEPLNTLDAKGAVAANLNVTGTPTDATVAAKVTWSDADVRLAGFEAGGTVDYTLNATLKGDLRQARIAAKGTASVRQARVASAERKIKELREPKVSLTHDIVVDLAKGEVTISKFELASQRVQVTAAGTLALPDPEKPRTSTFTLKAQADTSLVALLRDLLPKPLADLELAGKAATDLTIVSSPDKLTAKGTVNWPNADVRVAAVHAKGDLTYTIDATLTGGPEKGTLVAKGSGTIANASAASPKRKVEPIREPKVDFSHDVQIALAERRADVKDFTLAANRVRAKGSGTLYLPGAPAPKPAQFTLSADADTSLVALVRSFLPQALSDLALAGRAVADLKITSAPDALSASGTITWNKAAVEVAGIKATGDIRYDLADVTLKGGLATGTLALRGKASVHNGKASGPTRGLEGDHAFSASTEHTLNLSLATLREAIERLAPADPDAGPADIFAAADLLASAADTSTIKAQIQADAALAAVLRDALPKKLANLQASGSATSQLTVSAEPGKLSIKASFGCPDAKFRVADVSGAGSLAYELSADVAGGFAKGTIATAGAAQVTKAFLESPDRGVRGPRELGLVLRHRTSLNAARLKDLLAKLTAKGAGAKPDAADLPAKIRLLAQALGPSTLVLDAHTDPALIAVARDLLPVRLANLSTLGKKLGAKLTIEAEPGKLTASGAVACDIVNLAFGAQAQQPAAYPNTAVALTLTGDTVDVDKALALLGPEKAAPGGWTFGEATTERKPPTAPGTTPTSGSKVILPSLPPELRGMLSVKIGKLVYDKHATADLLVKASLADSLLTFTEVTAKPMGGTLKASGQVALGSRQPHSLSLEMANVKVGKEFQLLNKIPIFRILIAAIGGMPQELTFVAAAKIDGLTASGNTLDAVRKSAKGNGTVVLTNLHLVGSPLFQVIALYTGHPELGDLTFARMDAPFTVAGGRMDNVITLPYEQGTFIIQGAADLAGPIKYGMGVRNPRGIRFIPARVHGYLEAGHPFVNIGGNITKPTPKVPVAAIAQYLILERFRR